MVFAYFDKLNQDQQKTYLLSDRIRQVKFPNDISLRPLILSLKQALHDEDQLSVEQTLQSISQIITSSLGLASLQVNVLPVRPSVKGEELLCIHSSPNYDTRHIIYVWMYTSQQHHVVAYNTLLRLFTHELCHYIDHDYFRFNESFHTHGFYQRESELLGRIGIE